MGDTETGVVHGSSKGPWLPSTTVWASLSLAGCLGIRGGWGWLGVREQSPLSPQLWNA